MIWAGVIHTDFERGFIKAEVYAIPDLLEHGSETALKGVGKLIIEGKAYEVKDGDVMHFRFSAGKTVNGVFIGTYEAALLRKVAINAPR